MADEAVSASGPEWFPKRLGKQPAEPDAVAFRLASYVDLSLPEPPPSFGHPDPPPFYDFDNSKYGSCVWAGAANETSLWLHESGIDVSFTTRDVLADYSAVTGFDPHKPITDRGTRVPDAARYRRNVGILDANGRRQRIDAYAMLELGNVERLRTAMWLLGGVGLGFQFPSFAMAQAQHGEAWDVKPWSFSRMKGWLLGSEIAGGHYVPAIGWTKPRPGSPNGNIICISWGEIHEMTPAFYLKYADEVVCYLDLDRLNRVKRLSPEGFNERQLRRDLTALSGGRIPIRPRNDEYT